MAKADSGEKAPGVNGLRGSIGSGRCRMFRGPTDFGQEQRPPTGHHSMVGRCTLLVVRAYGLLLSIPIDRFAKGAQDSETVFSLPREIFCGSISDEKEGQTIFKCKT